MPDPRYQVLRQDGNRQPSREHTGQPSHWSMRRASALRGMRAAADGTISAVRGKVQVNIDITEPRDCRPSRNAASLGSRPQSEQLRKDPMVLSVNEFISEMAPEPTAYWAWHRYKDTIIAAVRASAHLIGGWRRSVSAVYGRRGERSRRHLHGERYRPDRDRPCSRLRR